jgi:SulP family sulfate permease
LFGMLLAVGLSLLLAIRRFAMPLVSELGQLGTTRDYVDHARHLEATLQPGVLIMRPAEPLFFANAEQVFKVVLARAKTRQTQVVVLSMEVSDDLDSTAVEALAEFAKALADDCVALLLARVKDKPRQALARVGLGTSEPRGKGDLQLFWSVDEAVRAAVLLASEPKKTYEKSSH